ncbi:MAG: hypothetical protein IKU78_01910 [Paludibacteraceae bacterium]|nr:hypothetical protein [Paludibacteraceae bacterium]
MDKHLTFEGIEFNIPLNKFIAKLETRGFVLETPPFGNKMKTAVMKGGDADYDGICEFLISTNTKGIVKSIIVTGEEHYLVDNVLADFDYFQKKAEEYKKYGLQLLDQKDDYFDEDDIDSIRDGSLEKLVAFKRESDSSSVMVSVRADSEDDTFNVSMLITCGEVSDKDINIQQDEIEFLESQILQRESNHLVFNGIEMSRILDDFVEELKSKGFRVKNESQWIENREIATMYGPFMGEPSELSLCSNSEGDISIILVRKKERKSFEVAKEEFYKLIDIYTKKYGSPSEMVDDLLYMSNPISALKEESAKLAALFKIGEYGSSISIHVKIEENSRFPYILISYFDGLNQDSFDDDITDDVDIDLDDIDLDDYYDDI